MFDNISKFKFKFNIPNGCGCMPQESAPADPGRDEDPARRAAGMPPGRDQPPPLDTPGGPYWEPVITRPDPMTKEEREAWLDALAGKMSRSTRKYTGACDISGSGCQVRGATQVAARSRS
jgi:hypothetical protein